MERFLKNYLQIHLSFALVLIGIISLFLPIVKYTDIHNNTSIYNVVGLIEGEKFSINVLSHYTGSFDVDIPTWLISLICIIGILAIISSITGIFILSKQRKNRFAFILTIIGLVGTAIPAISILVMILLSKSFFDGEIRSGFYPIITPIAMIFCTLTVNNWRTKEIKNTDEMVHWAMGGDL